MNKKAYGTLGVIFGLAGAFTVASCLPAEPEPEPAEVSECPEGWTDRGDLGCFAPGEEPEAEPQEDDPDFDCRYHGNGQCGVEIHGTWYVIEFVDGSPESVRVRD